jgi:hypothetical protein
MRLQDPSFGSTPTKEPPPLALRPATPAFESLRYEGELTRVLTRRQTS